MFANVPFSLGLTEQQRKAKDALILPYEHHLARQVEVVHDPDDYLDDDEEGDEDPSEEATKELKIDDDDDDDEEDPDADLDI